ncbi:MAG TPA: cobalt-precorrin 5A hydrolase, partial [Desulfotignum sp.]|nr:cobalt-precorrin 5A hydrolase [Desulfotignum sp.]
AQNKPIDEAAVAIWAITPNGRTLGRQLCTHVKQARLFISASLENTTCEKTALCETADEDASAVFSAAPAADYARPVLFHRLSDAVAAQFFAWDCHVFIFSTGIAVRILAPLLVSKLTDPAVVVMDDRGRHAISLISGHIGQANTYTRHIARMLNADPVITTATDVNNLPAIDVLAKNLGLFIETPGQIKTINMAFLQKRAIRIHDPLHLLSPWIPSHLITRASRQGPAVVCDWEKQKVPRETLVLRPGVLAVGIGCNRNTPFAVICEFFTATLETAGISEHAVAVLATTDVKQDEPGILALAAHLQIPVQFYDRTALASVETIQTPSPMVEKHLGVKSVCEAAAILASRNGTLVLPKQKNQDVTLAVALHPTGSLLSAPDQAM